MAPDMMITAIMNRIHSAPHYAFMDILVACPAHATLHRLCSEPLRMAGSHGRAAFHISTAA